MGANGLGDAVVAVEVVQNPPLGPRQTKRYHAPIVGRAQQPRDVVQDETKISR